MKRVRREGRITLLVRRRDSGRAGTVTRIEFDDVVWSKSAVVDRTFRADGSCQVHRACETRTQRLPICSPEQKAAKPWAELQLGPTWLVDTVIRTRGHLLVSRDTFSTMVLCLSGGCCNRHSTWNWALGPILCVSRATAVWGTNPDSAAICRPSAKWSS